MRNLVYRFDDSPSFARAVAEGDQELGLPPGETIGDGEWVLAMFEIGDRRRATAATGRGLHRQPGTPPVVAFERRDWERLEQFAAAGSLGMRAAEAQRMPSEPPPPTARLPVDPDGTLESAPPEAPVAAPHFAHWRRSDPFAQGPSARVLLVDDDRDTREVVTAMLDAVGLTVEAVASAEEALERLRAGQLDLMVLDWTLPGMTGIELCRLIRRDAALSTLPILFLSARTASQDVVEAFASGADDYVSKPFRAPELGARLFGLLRRARMGQPVP